MTVKTINYAVIVSQGHWVVTEVQDREHKDTPSSLGLEKWLGWGICFPPNHVSWLSALDKVSQDVNCFEIYDIIYSLR